MVTVTRQGPPFYDGRAEHKEEEICRKEEQGLTWKPDLGDDDLLMVILICDDDGRRRRRNTFIIISICVIYSQSV